MDGPTAYGDVNAVLGHFRTGVSEILGRQLVGIYLSGSLAGGDFDPLASDIDFVVATAHDVTDPQLDRLLEMYLELARTNGVWGSRLEGAYLPPEALRRHDSRAYPFVNEGVSLRRTHLDASWIINRHALRTCGIALVGPPPATLIDSVSPAELKAAVREELQEWWKPLSLGAEKMRSRRCQAFAVLTMCRALFTLQEGDVASKPSAAEWAEHQLPSEWTALIRRALTWRHDERIDDEALPETLRFLRFAIRQAE